MWLTPSNHRKKGAMYWFNCSFWQRIVYFFFLHLHIIKIYQVVEHSFWQKFYSVWRQVPRKRFCYKYDFKNKTECLICFQICLISIILFFFSFLRTWQTIQFRDKNGYSIWQEESHHNVYFWPWLSRVI